VFALLSTTAFRESAAALKLNPKALIGLAFFGSVGMMFLVLACALPQYG